MSDYSASLSQQIQFTVYVPVHTPLKMAHIRTSHIVSDGPILPDILEFVSVYTTSIKAIAPSLPNRDLTSPLTQSPISSQVQHSINHYSTSLSDISYISIAQLSSNFSVLHLSSFPYLVGQESLHHHYALLVTALTLLLLANQQHPIMTHRLRWSSNASHVYLRDIQDFSSAN